MKKQVWKNYAPGWTCIGIGIIGLALAIVTYGRPLRTLTLLDALPDFVTIIISILFILIGLFYFYSIRIQERNKKART